MSIDPGPRPVPALRRDRVPGAAPRIAARAARIVAWSAAHFAFVLGQQVAELLAPLLLVIGIGWAALPRLIGMIQTPDGQARDILNGVSAHIPATIGIAGHAVGALGLVVAGLVLMAVAALFSTLLGVIDREFYRGPG